MNNVVMAADETMNPIVAVEISKLVKNIGQSTSPIIIDTAYPEKLKVRGRFFILKMSLIKSLKLKLTFSLISLVVKSGSIESANIKDPIEYKLEKLKNVDINPPKRGLKGLPPKAETLKRISL